MERVYNPINAVADLVTLFFQPADAGTRLFQLGFQLAHASGGIGGGMISRFRHASLAFTAPRPCHVPLSAARYSSRIPRMTHVHTWKTLEAH